MHALRSRLPAYMVPAAFVTLTELPLTPNGKVDRRALPAPERRWGVTAMGRRGRRPAVAEDRSGDLHRQDLAGCAGLDDISVDDKFFDLGGHSLNAIQVMTRLEKELGYEVDFNDLVFQTLRQFAAVCEKHRTGGAPIG